MANKAGAGTYILLSLPLLVGGALIFFYYRKRKKLRSKYKGGSGGGTSEGGGGTSGGGFGGSGSFDQVYYVATASTPLNIREEPSTSSARVGSLPRGSKVFGRSSSTSGWVEVSTDGFTSLGFASLLFLSKTQPSGSGSSTSTSSGTGTSGGMTGSGGTTSGTGGVGRPTGFANYTQKYKVTTSSGSLNIRNAPNTSATIIEKAPKGTILLGKPSSTSGWIEISKDGNTLFGYASSSFLSIVI